MSYKSNYTSMKSVCDRCSKNNYAFYPYKSNKMTYRPIKKVIPSKKLRPNSSKEVKSSSTGVINNNDKIQNPRKITRSDINFRPDMSVVDFCAQCGDNRDNRDRKNGNKKSYEFTTLDSICKDLKTQVAIDAERSTNTNINNKKKLIQQYYKNEKFKPSTSSVKDIYIKNSNKFLDPIKEGTEGQVTTENSSETAFDVLSNPAEEIGYLDLDDDGQIENLKNFRKRNYFECHSAKSRITTKGSVTSLNDHKCVYRFYLNERLFPVPLHTDCHNNIRCVECHLPLEDINSNFGDSINGTVQTKVKIGNEIQDMILMLPVKKPLIVGEKRNLKREPKSEVLYFGIVRLNHYGDSVFNRTLPNDSLALRYQKGYKEFVQSDRYKYEKIKENDVVII